MNFQSEWAAAYPHVLAYCHRAIGDANTAEEVAQATAIRAWRGYEQFRRTSSFLTWVLSIARRETARVLARRRPLPVSLAGARGDSLDPPADSPPRIDWLPAAVGAAVAAGELSTEEGDVLLARMRAPGAGWAQVGASLGRTAAHCAVTHFRAVAKLRAFLFLQLPERLGGGPQIARAFADALKDEGRYRLGPAEATVFRRMVLDRDASYRTVGWRVLLQNACAKVIRHLEPT